MSDFIYIYLFIPTTIDAAELDKAIMDICPDNAMDLNNKKRMLRWDAKKSKFVKQTLREAAEGQKKGVKRMRTEQGVVMSQKSNVPQVRWWW